MKKIFVAIILSVLLTAGSAFAENFSAPVKIGAIGSPVQSPYHGFIVENATFNDGEPFTEVFERGGKPLVTYTRGTAYFGGLCCEYDFDAEIVEALNFGGANNFVLPLDGTYKEIFKIDGESLTLYAIYHNYCVTDLKILGERNGMWRVCIDSKKLSDKFFGGNDGYKMEGGVLYDVPTCAGDTLVVTYRRWNWSGASAPEGEFHFKWNEQTQTFDAEQLVY